MRLLKTMFVFVYLLSSLPVLASYHYCLGRVKQISFYELRTPDCGLCPIDEEPSDCCDTEQQEIVFQDDHVYDGSFVLVNTSVFAVQPLVVVVDIADVQVAPEIHGAHAPPPRFGGANLFLVFDSWLI
ncbi:MAG: hypothetical protein ACK417_09085 [Bacteroidia bacterium]